MSRLHQSRPAMIILVLAAALTHASGAAGEPASTAGTSPTTLAEWQVADGLFDRLETPAEDQPGPVPEETTAPVSLTGLWSGTYTCNQGSTLLDLALEDLGKGLVWGTFGFHAPLDNLSVPSGLFTMAGRYDPHSRQIDLYPGDWLVQPDGYATVGMTGEFTIPADDPASAAIVGTVNFDGCGAFEVRRVDGTAVTLGPVPEPIHTLLNEMK